MRFIAECSDNFLSYGLKNIEVNSPDIIGDEQDYIKNEEIPI
jgi:hypothetical protein